MNTETTPTEFQPLPLRHPPLFESSLTLSTVVAVILHQLLRLGSGSGIPATSTLAAEMTVVPIAQIPLVPADPPPDIESPWVASGPDELGDAAELIPAPDSTN